MKVVCDIEANGLENPTEIHVIVCKDIDSGDIHVFRKKEEFKDFAKNVTLWVGHNWLGFDYPVLNRLGYLNIDNVSDISIDTLIISKLVDYPRERHSVEDYGIEFNFHKIDNKGEDFFKKYTKELEEYCIRDVEITYKIYLKYKKYIDTKEHSTSILLEHRFQYYVINVLSNNGFSFNITKSTKLLSKVEEELSTLDKEILRVFTPKSKLIREVVPRVTKYNTISKSSIPKKLRDYLDNDLSCFSPDAPFSYISFEEFNPASHKQIIDVLHNAGWSPTDKTKTRIDDERECNKLKHSKTKDLEVDLRLKELYTRLQQSEKYGWKINENNLSTLPSSAPSPARYLAQRILLEARRRTLTEWLGLTNPDTGRIHGKFYGIGAWTHRMAHQQPNTANIPNEFDTAGNIKLLGKEMRQLWQAPKNRLLVGVDAEGIQLRIFAHYINDPEFTDALVKGKKDDKTDPHSLNQRILGSVCKSRAAAKRFIYALLLGAGINKLTEILGCTQTETQEALNRLMERYTGWAYLKEKVLPKDAKRGYFIGLDRRKVRIPGDTEGMRRHLAMSGYLQCGEAVCMKLATLKWINKLKDYNAILVNFVHDEWQVECPNDVSKAMEIAKIMAKSLEEVGKDLNLNCPLAGSYWNDDHKDYTIGTNWYQTH